MKRVLMGVVMLGVVSHVCAGTFPASISREPLVRSTVSDRLSIGVGYDWIERDIDLGGNRGSGVLEASSASVYIGYDGLPWLTTFATVGATELSGGSWRETDFGPRFSVGLNAYLWEADVLTPAFAAGRVSVKAMTELARHEADTSTGTSDWVAWFAALPIGYEMFDRYPASKSGLSTSLALYAGPAISMVSGSAAVSSGVKQSFDQDQILGAVVGADVFFAPSVAVGFNALIFGEASLGASLRFHF